MTTYFLLWVLVVKACAGGDCRHFESRIGSLYVCQARADIIKQRAPSVPPALWGFPKAKDVRVAASCEKRSVTELPA